jgi:hypothetical protein
MAVQEEDVHVEADEVRVQVKEEAQSGLIVDGARDFVCFSPYRYSRRTRLR